MKTVLVFSLLAAIVTLPLTSASPTNLLSRQFSPQVIACTQNSDCKYAFSYWVDCQNATTVGSPEEPDSGVRNCLCDAKVSNPSHPDWQTKLQLCVFCVEQASENFEVSLDFQQLVANWCNNTQSLSEFEAEAQSMAVTAGFPLQLPEATLSSIALTATETCNEIKAAQTSTALGVATTTTAQTTTKAGAVTALVTHGPCNFDNCLRQAQQSAFVVSSFCNTYTTAAQTATAGYPGFVSMCNNSPSSISSVCYCLASIEPNPTQPQTSAVSSASVTEATTTTPLQVHTVTDWVYSTTIIWVTVGASTSTVQSPTTFQTSTTPSASSVAPPPPPSSSSTSSAASSSTGWVTLPASDAIKACLASTNCQTAKSLYNQCSSDSVNGNDTLSWNCFCQTNLNQWKSSLTACGACVAQNLPTNPTGNTPTSDMVPGFNIATNAFCNVTDAGVKATSLGRLDQIGVVLTTAFESPIEFPQIILLTAPISPNATASTSVAPSSTTSASPSTSSSTISLPAQPTWITLPPSQAMLQCQANACQPAAQIYNTCIKASDGSTNQDPIFDCFCTSNKNQWQSTLSTCTTCIAAALPATNPHATLQASQLNSQTELTRQVFCNQTETAMSTVTLTILQKFGEVITSAFESPIEFFNMTLTPAPFTFPNNVPRALSNALDRLPSRKRGVDNLVLRAIFDALDGLH